MPLLFLPETFAPAILMSRAKKIRKENPGSKTYAALELQPKISVRQFATKVLGRPMRMLVGEPIVTACCLYLSLIYAVVFMLFQAYPIIFTRKTPSFEHSSFADSHIASYLQLYCRGNRTRISSK